MPSCICALLERSWIRVLVILAEDGIHNALILLNFLLRGNNVVVWIQALYEVVIFNLREELLAGNIIAHVRYGMLLNP